MPNQIPPARAAGTAGTAGTTVPACCATRSGRIRHTAAPTSTSAGQRAWCAKLCTLSPAGCPPTACTTIRWTHCEPRAASLGGTVSGAEVLAEEGVDPPPGVRRVVLLIAHPGDLRGHRADA